MARKLFILTFFVFTLCAGSAFADDPVSKGLALTPPMGFNTWNKFGCNVSDELVRGMADAVVESGMKVAGYQYGGIDDCWQGSRDATDNIATDARRLPQGLNAVAAYVRSL